MVLTGKKLSVHMVDFSSFCHFFSYAHSQMLKHGKFWFVLVKICYVIKFYRYAVWLLMAASIVRIRVYKSQN